MSPRTILASVLLAATAASAAEPMTLLIFAGGATADDARAALTSFEKLRPLVARVITLPAGEPRVVESSTLPGLKPGFHVVTLGLCRAPADALAALKAVYPGTYARPLTGDAGPERCPTVTDAQVAAVEPTVKVGSVVVNAFTVTETSEDDRGHEVKNGTVGVVVVDKKSGLVLDAVSVEGASVSASGDGPSGREYLTCGVAVSAERAGFVVVRSCTDERTGCARKEAEIPREWTETDRVVVKGQKATTPKMKRDVTRGTPCVAGGMEGD